MTLIYTPKVDNSVKNNNFESKIENDGNGIEHNNDEQRSSDSARVVDDTNSKIPSIGGRGEIRVLEEGLDFERYDHPKYSERDRRIAESKRLVDVAKKNILFIPYEETKSFQKLLMRMVSQRWYGTLALFFLITVSLNCRVSFSIPMFE